MYKPKKAQKLQGANVVRMGLNMHVYEVKVVFISWIKS